MSRTYVCTSCNLPQTAQTARGPLPKRCPQCNPRDVKVRDRAGGVRPPRSSALDTKPDSLIAQEKVARAIQLRLQYRSWYDIAEQLGWSTHSGPRNAVMREMERRRAAMDESLDEMRARELDRLEALGRAALEVLNKRHLVISAGTVVTHNGVELIDDGPTLAAVNTLVKVSESLRRLLGLDAAQKVDAAVTVQYTVQGIPESEMP